MTFRTLQGKVLTSLLIGVVVLLGLSLLSDIQAVGSSLRSFGWAYLPAILGLTLLNYGVRWAKWDYFLRYLGQGQGVSYGDSVLLFTAGMVMAVTPGKLGEVLKSYLLRRVNGTPVSASAPIVLVERVTDGLGMLLLMGLGLTLYPPARPLFGALVLASGAGIALLQYRALCERLLDQVARLPKGATIAPRLRTLYTNTRHLLGWRVLLVATLLSVVSWGFECVALYLVLVGLGEPGTGLLLLHATFIFAASTLFGLVSFLPGGLGTSEVTSAGLLITLVGLGSGAATTATILIRFCTLWFGVGLGLVALLWFGRRYPQPRPDELTDASPELPSEREQR